jgi:hypothetical protein
MSKPIVILDDVPMGGGFLVPPGTRISFSVGSDRVFAEVRYCCVAPPGFLCGARIEKCRRSSSRHVENAQDRPL